MKARPFDITVIELASLKGREGGTERGRGEGWRDNKESIEGCVGSSMPSAADPSIRHS